jgi:S-adenosyl methyltransferase
VPDFDVNTPHIARIYDYWLGGRDNFEADRKAAELALAATPTIVPGVRANRRFLGRAVRYMAVEHGIRQFLDIGTGIPASDNTHEVAQRVAPEARVVYVDNDPIVLTHARALLTSATGPTAYIDADAREFGPGVADQVNWAEDDLPEARRGCRVLRRNRPRRARCGSGARLAGNVRA